MGSFLSSSKLFRLCAFVLISGTTLTNIGCNKSIDNLFFTIEGKDLEFTFCDRGASIYSIKYKNQFVTYQPNDKEIFLGNNFYGKCLGRVTGRIPDGKLKIGDQEYSLGTNDGKHNCLNGGKDALNTKDWAHEIVENNDYYDVIFRYLSPSGESGFPETLDIKYTYRLSKITSKFDLIIDADASGLTPINLSSHPYFRLADTGNVLNHTLTINAENMGKFDSEGHQRIIGIKEIENDSPWDFKTGKNIGKDIGKALEQDPASGGYDHIWYFGDNTNENERSCKVELSNSATGIKLNVESENSDGVILYANCHPSSKNKMNDGEVDMKYAAISIEPYTFFTIEQESIEKLFIDKEKHFTRKISYTFSNF